MKIRDDSIKIWMFYKVATGYDFEAHAPQFYAWTNDKYLADNFIKSRNMAKVFRYKIVEMPKPVYNSLCIKHNQKRLVQGGLATKDINMQKICINMIMTEYEEFQCSIRGEDLMVRDAEVILHNYATKYIECLKSKYLNTLNNYRMFEYLVYTDSVDRNNDFYSSIVANAESGTYLYTDLPQVDGAALFIALYGYTIKEGYEI